MWNNPQYNFIQNNNMTNFYINYNNNFNNGFNSMNPNQMNMNNNFQNNYFFNNMMMNINQNMMLQNMNNKILQMKQNNFKNKLEQILIESEVSNNINNANEIIPKEEEEEKESEEQKKMNEALSDVVKEQLAQKQNFENLQPPQNLNYDEVDPEFINTFISDTTLFCGRGHNLIGKWAHGESRGGRTYNPPEGWIGFGLNVINKYDNGNNDWLACDGRPGEWCVAFHGACVRSTSDQIKQIIKPILEKNLKPGAGQAYRGHDDANHPGHKVGVGVYCTPNPASADGYAGIIEVNGFKYKVAFMLRVKPDKIRYSTSRPDYWVLNAGNGDFSEIRPYRFLIKKVS